MTERALKRTMFSYRFSRSNNAAKSLSHTVVVFPSLNRIFASTMSATSFLTRRIADEPSALTLGYAHELQIIVNQRDHLSDQLADFPLRSTAQSLVTQMNQLSQIQRHIQRRFTGIGQDVSCVLIRRAVRLILGVPFGDNAHVVIELILTNRGRYDVAEAVLIAVTLTALGVAGVTVAYQLMRTRTTDTVNAEGEVDMLKRAVMPVFIQVRHQYHRIFRIAVVTNRSNLRNRVDGIGR